MDTDKHGLALEQESGEIIGCAMEVMNTLGHGLLEKPYENALAVELSQRNVSFVQQPHFNVVYKGVKVGEYIPDIIVRKKIIVDTKTIERVGDHEIGQMLNYLKITNLRIGLIINFKHARLQWKRVVL